MLVLAALNIGVDFVVGAAALLLVWIVAAAMTATYGRDLGYPFVPLFLAALFIGWPLVLLAVTVAGARREPRGARTAASVGFDRAGQLLELLQAPRVRRAER